MVRVTAPGPEPKRCGMWRTRNCSPDSVNAAAPIRVAGTTTTTSTSRQAAKRMRRRRTAGFQCYNFGEKLMCSRGPALRDSGCAMSMPSVSTGVRKRMPMPAEYSSRGP